MGVDVSFSIKLINSELKRNKEIPLSSFGAANSKAFESLFYKDTTVRRTSIPLNMKKILTKKELDIFKLYMFEENEGLFEEENDCENLSQVMPANIALTILKKIELALREDSISCLLRDIGQSSEIENQRSVVTDYYNFKSDLACVCVILEVAQQLNYDVQFVALHF